MGKDYYGILGVGKQANEDELKKAYRKLAAKYHPDKVRGSDAEKAAATEKFKEVGEAMDVLSDPEKRKVYDMFGEEGLKGGVPPGGAAGGAGPQGFSGGYNFDASAAQRLFEQLFGGLGGFGNMAGMGGMGGMGGGHPHVRVFQTGGGPGMGGFQSNGGPGMGAQQQFFFNRNSAGTSPDGSDEEMHAPGYGGSPFTRGRGAFDGMDFDMGGDGGLGGAFGGFGAGQRRPRQPPNEQVVQLPLSLEQLYTGVKKKLRVTRKLHDAATNQAVPVQEVLELEVRPGWKSGTRITFEGKGDELPGRRAQDLVFVVAEQPHNTFTRKGNDLYTTVQVPLVTALTGGTVYIKQLDGRSVPVAMKEPVLPGSERLLVGEGMPISKQPGLKGDLHVKCDVQFPRNLTDQQKQAIRRALA